MLLYGTFTRTIDAKGVITIASNTCARLGGHTERTVAKHFDPNRIVACLREPFFIAIQMHTNAHHLETNGSNVWGGWFCFAWICFFMGLMRVGSL